MDAQSHPTLDAGLVFWAIFREIETPDREETAQPTKKRMKTWLPSLLVCLRLGYGKIPNLL
jgi:hypothetical protein